MQGSTCLKMELRIISLSVVGLRVSWVIVCLLALTTVIQGAVATNLEDPRIVEHPEDKYVARNQPATLNCKAEGSKPPIITWYRNGRQVITATENPSSHRMLLPNGQLFFLSIKHTKNSKPDVGIYYCNASNPDTKKWVISRNATLEIAVLRDDFKTNPQDKRVAVGDTATLECRPPKGLPEPRVHWKKDSLQIEIGGRMRVENGGNLIIPKAEKADSGTYICVAANMAGQKESIPARLSVEEKPKIMKAPIDVDAQENEDIKFECKVAGDPTPSIDWRKKGGAIPPGRYQILPDKSLLIRRVKVEDDGVYICRATNSVGFMQVEARLTVQSQPSFLFTPRNKVVGVGSTVSLKCQVTGNPPPAVFWSKGNTQDLMFPKHNHGRFSVTQDGTLIIQRVRKIDAGEYVCQALNAAGSALAKARLTVKDIDPRPPPIIHLGPQNQTLAVNSIALLRCQASGDPAPIIHWYKDRQRIDGTDPRFTQLDTGTLQISDLRKEDTGKYSCEAVSETGTTTWNASLTVEKPSDPTIIFHRTPEPATFPGPPSKPSVSNIQDHSLRLSWKPNSNQGASQVFAYTVEYFSYETGQGWQVASDNIRVQTYTVRHLQPDTSYLFLVRAQNAHGMSMPSQVSEPVRTTGTAGAKPTIDVDPSLIRARLRNVRVDSLHAVALNGTFARITWLVERRHKQYVEGFHIRYRIKPSSPRLPYNDPYREQQTLHFSTVTITGFNQEGYLTGLEEDTIYEVKVRSFYSTEEGPESELKDFRTKIASPSAPPTSIKVRIVKDDTIFLTWSPPLRKHHNGALKGYRIYIFGNESKFNRNITVNATTHRATVANLVPGMHYRIQLMAFNKAGIGVRSAEINLGGSSYGMFQGIVKEPWFIATLIGTIGGTLWFALCVFSIWLYRKRRIRKKGLKSSVVTVPVHKPDDPNRATITNQTPLLANHNESGSGSQGNQVSSHPTLMFQNGISNTQDTGSNYLAYGYPRQPDLTNMLGAHHKEEQTENLYNTPVITTPQMKTFYNKANPLPSVAPYATTTLVTANCQLNKPPPESAFRPINRGYQNHGSCSGDSCMKQEQEQNSSDSNTDNSRPNTEMRHDSHEPLISSMAVDYPEMGKRGKQAPKNPVLNFADILPPPPEHPPSPSEIGTPPDSPTHHRRGRDQDCRTSDRGSTHYYHTHAPINSIPLYDGGCMHRAVMSDSERHGGPPGRYYDPHNINMNIHENRTHSPGQSDGYACGHMVGAPGHSPTNRSQSPQYRSISPRCVSEPEGPVPPVRAYKLVPLKDHELARHYSDTERGPTPPVRMLLHMPQGGTVMAEEVPDPVMDRGCQSSLPSLVNEPQDSHRMDEIQNGTLTNGSVQDQVRPGSPASEGLPEYVGDSDVEGHRRPECGTPESSVGEVDSVTGSMLASWASVTDNSNSGCSSARSSAVSTSDGSFCAEADFASAVAKAAELSGLTVVGSTVMDPQAAGKKKKNYRHRPRRPTSPYSTDSNFSEVPHKPYPKSQRKRQLQEQANKYGHPSSKPRPPVRVKPNSLPQNPVSSNADLPAYNKPNFPSPTSNGNAKMSQGRQSNGSKTPTSVGGDSDSTLRANPLALLDIQDTPIV